MSDKTIRELAVQLNISKESIYKKINYSMRDKLKDHIYKNNRKTYVTDQGQLIISKSLKKEIQENNFEVNNQNKEVGNQNKEVANQFNLILILEKHIVSLKKENEKLLKLNKELTYILNLNKKEKLIKETKIKENFYIRKYLNQIYKKIFFIKILKKI